MFVGDAFDGSAIGRSSLLAGGRRQPLDAAMDAAVSVAKVAVTTSEDTDRDMGTGYVPCVWRPAISTYRMRRSTST